MMIDGLPMKNPLPMAFQSGKFFHSHESECVFVGGDNVMAGWRYANERVMLA